VCDDFGWAGFTVHAPGMARTVDCLRMVVGFFSIARF
jgi:uncharacterized membrane protein YdcZ (DUF606 family)